MGNVAVPMLAEDMLIDWNAEKSKEILMFLRNSFTFGELKSIGIPCQNRIGEIVTDFLILVI